MYPFWRRETGSRCEPEPALHIQRGILKVSGEEASFRLEEKDFLRLPRKALQEARAGRRFALVQERSPQPRAQHGKRIVAPVQGGQAEAGLQAERAFLVGADLEERAGAQELEEELHLASVQGVCLAQPLLQHGEALGVASRDEAGIRHVYQGPEESRRIVGFLAQSLRHPKIFDCFPQSSLREHRGPQPEIEGPISLLRAGGIRRVASRLLAQEQALLQLFQRGAGIAGGKKELRPLDADLTAQGDRRVDGGPFARLRLRRLGGG